MILPITKRTAKEFQTTSVNYKIIHKDQGLQDNLLSKETKTQPFNIQSIQEYKNRSKTIKNTTPKYIHDNEQEPNNHNSTTIAYMHKMPSDKSCHILEHDKQKALKNRSKVQNLARSYELRVFKKGKLIKTHKRFELQPESQSQCQDIQINQQNLRKFKVASKENDENVLDVQDAAQNDDNQSHFNNSDGLFVCLIKNCQNCFSKNKATSKEQGYCSTVAEVSQQTSISMQFITKPKFYRQDSLNYERNVKVFQSLREGIDFTKNGLLSRHNRTQ